MTARPDTLVLEAADAIGIGMSPRDSELIHAALHYPTGSIKATACLSAADGVSSVEATTKL